MMVMGNNWSGSGGVALTAKVAIQNAIRELCRVATIGLCHRRAAFLFVLNFMYQPTTLLSVGWPFPSLRHKAASTTSTN